MVTDTTKQLNDPESDPSDFPAKARQKIDSLRVLVQELVHEVETLKISDATQLTPGSFYEEVRRYEVELICGALSRSRGNQKEAARLLGILPTTLNAMIRRYNIQWSAFRLGRRAQSTNTCNAG